MAVEWQLVQPAHPDPIVLVHAEAQPLLYLQESYKEPPNAHQVPRKVSGWNEATQSLQKHQGLLILCDA